VLKRNPGLLPKPLDTALSQVWGYASNEARHVEEGREPNREEAELLVGLAAIVATLVRTSDEDEFDFDGAVARVPQTLVCPTRRA
jgi:hypothetical protein